jgi:hypothetical protein
MSRRRKVSPGAALVRMRWDKATEEERKAEGVRLTEARRQKLTPEQRKEIARKAGIASAAARWGFHEEQRKAAIEKAGPNMDPELVKARRREIASTAAKARWAKARAAEQTGKAAGSTDERKQRKRETKLP